MISYRDLVATIFRERLSLLDSVNNSIDFGCVRRELTVAPQVDGRMALHEHVAHSVQDKAITYLEFGVWKGESFRKWLALNCAPDSRFVGFDTFTGLPEDWTTEDQKGAFSTDGRQPSIEDERADFRVGLFQDTLYGFLESYVPRRPVIVHVDCDLYSSTLFVLAALDRFFSPGAIVILDDFHSLNHEFAAWVDYRRSFYRKWTAIGKTRRCIQTAWRLVSAR